MQIKFKLKTVFLDCKSINLFCRFCYFSSMKKYILRVKNIIFLFTLLFTITLNSQGWNSLASVNSLSEINGTWKNTDYTLKIDVQNKTIQYIDLVKNNDMKMYLDYSTATESEDFLIFGRIGNSNGRAVLSSRVKLSADKQKIYLSRTDGGVSSAFKKWSDDGVRSAYKKSSSKKSTMAVVLGYVIVLLISFFGLTMALSTLPVLMFLNVFKLKNANLVHVLSFFLIYQLIDLVWYFFYDYHLSFLLLLLIAVNNLRGQISGQLYGDGLKVVQAETFTVGLFALYIFVFFEFNWV